MGDNEHRHCWHNVYWGQGEWINLCCECGAFWVPMDFRYAEPPQSQAHGPYVTAEGGRRNPDGQPMHMLSNEEVFALTGAVPCTPENDVHHHTHVINLP